MTDARSLWRLLDGYTYRSPKVHGTYSEPTLRRRALRQKPSPLADAPEGPNLCVRGIVRELVPAIPGPLTGNPCVYHQTHVDLSTAGRIAVREHARSYGGVSFLIEDSAGNRAVVDPTHARVSVRFDQVTRSAAAFDADPHQRALLDLVPITSWFSIDFVLYYEALLEIGSEVSVVGGGAREADPDTRHAGSYRDAPTRLYFAGTAKAPLLICGRPDDRVGWWRRLF